MTSESSEHERKFEVTPDLPLAGLDTLPGVTRAVVTAELQLEANYYDTTRFSLLRAGITLRLRTGGDDAGWTLKLPVGRDERTEITAPPTDGSAATKVPTELLDRARAWVRDHELQQVATIQTRRVTHRLLDEHEQTLAEVSDDSVTSTAPGTDGVTLDEWREWEVELIAGPDEFLDAATQLILDLGATAPPRSSKLERALGRQSATATDDLSPKSEGGLVLQSYFREQLKALLTNDNGVREDLPDSVHKMRVACRRLRSALTTFRPLVEREVTDPIRDELKQLATILGAARDAEVQRERFDHAIEAEPVELVMGPVENWINLDLAAQYRKAHATAVRAVSSPQYFRLLDRLDDLAESPPLTEAAQQRAKVALTQQIRKAYQHLSDRVVDARVAGTDADRDHLMHEARKKAKRLRYAAEAVSPAFGEPATTFAEAIESVQEILGEHQDSVVARQVLRDMAARAFLDGQNTFTFGRLHAAEEAKALEAERDFDGAWEMASKKHLRHWLK